MYSLPFSFNQAKPQKIMQVIRHASSPVVIFPEGIRSNGKSVLKFLPILEHLDLGITGNKPLCVHLIAFRYEYKHFSPSFSAGNDFSYFLWICFYLYHHLRVTLLDGKFIDLKDDENLQAKTITSRQSERLRGLLAAMLRTKPVDLSVQDFISFQKYWSHLKKGGKKPASAFTQRKAPHEHAQWTK
jgi:1-acyl-sn-glycerol-3-phosphate acyltransferase